MKTKLLILFLFLLFAAPVLRAQGTDSFDANFDKLSDHYERQYMDSAWKTLNAEAKRSPHASFLMALAYTSRDWASAKGGVDTDKARKLLEGSAKKKYIPAQLQLAANYLRNGDKADGKKAFDICKKLGMMEALAQMLAEQEPKEIRSVLSRFEKRAKSDPDNAVLYAFFLFQGNCIDQDPERAVELLENAVKKDKNHAEAHYLLYRCYQEGCGVAADSFMANEHLKKALDAGSPQALFLAIAVGTSYCPQMASLTDAVFAPIADYNYIRATDVLNRSYFYPADATRAELGIIKPAHIKKVEELAKAGLPMMIGLMYEIRTYGIGQTAADPSAAEYWFRKRRIAHDSAKFFVKQKKRTYADMKFDESKRARFADSSNRRRLAKGPKTIVPAEEVTAEELASILEN